MDNADIVYMSYDADAAGRKIGRAILSDRPDQLKEASERIELGNEIVERWAKEYNGVDYCSGGDQGVWAVPANAIETVDHLRADYEFATGLTITVGIGRTLSESGKALLVGKFRGKNMVVQYDPSMEDEIRQAEIRAKDGTASAEEKKISEAYLQDGQAMATENKTEQDKSALKDHTGCPYCQAMETEGVEDPTHCQYCHDDEQPEPCKYCNDSATPTDDCPYCNTSKSHSADCPYCQDASSRVPDAGGGTDQAVTPTAGPTVKNPTTTDSENYVGQDLNNPDLPKPPAIQPNPDGLGTSFDTPSVENTKLAAQGQGDHDASGPQGPQIDPQSEATVQEIQEQIDELPPTEQLPPETGNPIDDANMAVGTNMEDGVSRPDDFEDDNTPRDLGLSEGQEPPDMTELMQEGLDTHAESIAREKVINLVSEALVGFKASRQILEKAKLQAPQLYESSIAMLKAMIEMCKMLGLDQEAGATDEDAQNPLGSDEAQDQPMDGSAPPALAHTGENQNPTSSIPHYVNKEAPAKK